MCERFIGNLVKLVHSSIAEGKEPCKNLQSFLREYRITVHPSMARSPNSLMFGRELHGRIYQLKDFKGEKVHGMQRFVIEIRNRINSTKNTPISGGEPER